FSTDGKGNFAPDFAATFGADGQGATPTGYTLGVSTAGVDSGVIDTQTGNHVFLRLEAGEVVGRAGADSGAAASGPVVFVVSVSSAGVVTLDQIRAVVHPNPNDPDEASA